MDVDMPVNLPFLWASCHMHGGQVPQVVRAGLGPGACSPELHRPGQTVPDCGASQGTSSCPSFSVLAADHHPQQQPREGPGPLLSAASPRPGLSVLPGKPESPLPAASCYQAPSSPGA